MEHPVKEIGSVVRALTQGTTQQQQDALYSHFLPDAGFVHPFCRVPRFRGVAVPGFGEVNSRMLVRAIFRWYKILSPRIELEIESTVFDQRAGLLYLTISQTFAFWFLPFYRAPVRLVTVLRLVQCHVGPAGAGAQVSPVVGTNGPSATTESSASSSATASPSSPEGGRNGIHALTNSTSAGPSSFDDSSDGRPMRYMIAQQEDLYQVNEFVKFFLPGVGSTLWYYFQLLSTSLCVLGVLLLGPYAALLDRVVAQQRLARQAREQQQQQQQKKSA